MEQQLKQIGKRIAICRKNLDLSQKDFASKLNISIIIFQILKMVNLRQVSCCLWIFVLY